MVERWRHSLGDKSRVMTSYKECKCGREIEREGALRGCRIKETQNNTYDYMRTTSLKLG